MPKYFDINTIPARTFFEILHSKNYQLLCPKPKEKGLEQIFISIYDEFFVKSNNPEANEYLKVTKEIAFLKYKIAYLKQALAFYYYNQTTKQMRLDFIEAVKVGYDIEINPDVDFIDEVQRVLNIEIGIIQNDLSMAEFIFKQMTAKSKAKVFEYESQIVALENVLERNILDNITLAKYIAYEKSAQQKISAMQSKNKRAA